MFFAAHRSAAPKARNDDEARGTRSTRLFVRALRARCDFSLHRAARARFRQRYAGEAAGAPHSMLAPLRASEGRKLTWGRKLTEAFIVFAGNQ